MKSKPNVSLYCSFEFDKHAALTSALCPPREGVIRVTTNKLLFLANNKDVQQCFCVRQYTSTRPSLPSLPDREQASWVYPWHSRSRSECQCSGGCPGRVECRGCCSLPQLVPRLETRCLFPHTLTSPTPAKFYVHAGGKVAFVKNGIRVDFMYILIAFFL